MLDHVFLTVSNVERSTAFYERALAPLGIIFGQFTEGLLPLRQVNCATCPDRECWPSSPSLRGNWLSFFASPVHDVPLRWVHQCLAPMRLVCSISRRQPVP